MSVMAKIHLLPGRDEHREFSYRVKRAAFATVIARLGWDEARQRRDHDMDWREVRPRIIHVDDEPVGTVRIRTDKGYYSVSQFCVLPAWQRRGIGSCVLGMLLDEADEEGLCIRLACLPDNPARRLYERHGFRQVSADETFVYLEREPVYGPADETGDDV